MDFPTNWFSKEELEALNKLCEKQELSQFQLLRQALRMYQAVIEGHYKLVETKPLSKKRVKNERKS